MATCEQAATWLAEAETALHKLSTGTGVEWLTHADKHIRYTAANVDALRKYVAQLQAQVNACNGTARPARGFRFEPSGW